MKEEGGDGEEKDLRVRNWRRKRRRVRKLGERRGGQEE